MVIFRVQQQLVFNVLWCRCQPVVTAQRRCRAASNRQRYPREDMRVSLVRAPCRRSLCGESGGTTEMWGHVSFRDACMSRKKAGETTGPIDVEDEKSTSK